MTMPSPDDGIPWDQVDEEVWRLHERQRQEDALLGRLRAGTNIDFRQTVDLRAEILHGPERAAALCQRHEGLNRSSAILEALLALRTQPAVTKKQKLHEISSLIDRQGAFLMHYEPPLIEERLSSPQWVIAEAEGRQINPGPDFWQILKAADCQCHLPEDATGAAPVVNLPEDGDVVWSDAYMRAIRGCPASAGIVADICSEDRMAHLRLAGEARHKAFRHIMGLERAHPVRFMAAEIFSVRGAEDPHGERILLGEHGEPPVGNWASFYIHEHSRRGYAATLGWILRERKVPVSWQGETYHLLTDWYVMIHDLERARRHCAA